jgi:hypothetical protein
MDVRTLADGRGPNVTLAPIEPIYADICSRTHALMSFMSWAAAG